MEQSSSQYISFFSILPRNKEGLFSYLHFKYIPREDKNYCESQKLQRSSSNLLIVPVVILTCGMKNSLSDFQECSRLPKGVSGDTTGV